MRRFRLHAFGFIMYLVLALLKVALVNFTLNEYMTLLYIAMASWVKNVGEAASCDLLTYSCKFLTALIMGAQNYNFYPTFSQNGGF